MRYADPGQSGAKVTFKSRYDNFIGGRWVAPVRGQYFDNPTPVTGRTFCQVARSTEEDVNLALDAAHAAADAWGRTPVAQRAAILNKIADRIEANLEMIAVAETWDNGKPVRETLAADIPLAVDHFRYFASCIRAQEGALSEVDETTVAYHFHEPLGVVGQGPRHQGRARLDQLLPPDHRMMLDHYQIDGCPFYMSRAQFEYWRHTHRTIDVVPGRGGMFSLENPTGKRFLTRSRLFTDEEAAALAAQAG